MDLNKIRTLLEQYWKGETEVHEEKELQRFFSEVPDLPPDLQTEKLLFQYFSIEKNTPALDEDLTQKIKSTWKTPVRKIPAWKKALRYAAVLLPLVIAGYLVFQKKTTTKTSFPEDTYDDPQKAIAETEKALLLLSKNMNDGLSKMQSLKLFEEVKNTDRLKKENSKQP